MNRFRRLRSSKTIRDWVRETRLTPDDLVQPYFVIEGAGKRQTIEAMPGIERLSVDLLLKQIESFVKVGGKAGLLFGLPSKKDSQATEAYSDRGIVQKAVRAIKRKFPEFVVITDVCLCAYMDHGHCGVIHNGKIDNDATLPILGKTALSHAQAGADVVAPSDMMDFRVRQIRKDLDQNNFNDTLILSYAVKYASAFYGPFREAAHSAPAFGDRKTYQMDPANAREALKEAKQDIKEGADLVMVKPALAYLDVISLLRQNLNTPVAAYNVSGEYSMIKSAAKNKWINEKDVVLESLTAMKRAGANVIISYHAKEALKWIT